MVCCITTDTIVFFRQKFTKDKMTSTINQRLQLFIGGDYKTLLDLWEQNLMSIGMADTRGYQTLEP